MFSFIFKKMFMVIPTMIGITLLTFLLLHLLPGDPVAIRLGERPVSQEAYQEMLIQLGLDKPLWKQYFIYIKNAIHGDFGNSFFSGEPAISEFFYRFPATVQLSIFAAFFAIIFGIPLGIIAALKKGSFIDHIIMTIALLGYSMPVFWWGIILMLIFSVNFGLTPVSGYISAEYFVDRITGFSLIDSYLSDDDGAFKSALSHMILPTIVLGTIPMAILARMTRSSLIEVILEDYIRAVRAKGLSYYRVVIFHGLRNALIPVITVMGLVIGGLLSGAILTETIFSWPGIGKFIIEAIRNRDYPIVQASVFIIAIIIVVINLIVDVLYGLINPRIRDSS